MSEIAIIGGGAAGMLAAIAAAENGHQVHLFEKNEKLGKKLFITGKGRCNITNACDVEDLLNNVVTNPKFLYSAFYTFDSYAMMSFLEGLGLKLKVERGNRVFPQSDKSSDVIQVLTRRLTQLKVRLHLRAEVADILITAGAVSGICLKSGEIKQFDGVIVATGGLSYQTTGSTGDGYRFARTAGHQVTALNPALVPVRLKEWTAKELQGLSLKNVRVQVYEGRKKLYEEFGEMLFTHYGASGPLILSASSHLGKSLKQQELNLVIDLKPALSAEQLDARILRDFEAGKNKQFSNSLAKLLPSKLIPVIIGTSGIPPEKKVNEISREERGRLVRAMKELSFTITGLRDYNEAVITQGGVSVKEINPATMESKLVSGLYFIGEVLDLDAVTGGYNLQIAWSTAYLAGKSII